MTKAERIAALLKHEHNTVKDPRVLELVSDEVITIFETQAETEKTAADKKAADEKAAADEATRSAAAAQPKTLTKDEFMAAAPQSVKDIIQQHEAREAAEKTQLVAQLKVAAKGVYTDAELDKMSVSELSKLANLAKVSVPVDYSGRPIPAAPGTRSAEDFTPPDGYAEGLKVQKAQTVN